MKLRFPCLLCLFFILSIIINCIPPPNWKPSPYLIARFSGTRLKKGALVRVKLHEGRLLPISSVSMFKFKSRTRSKFFRGYASYTPQTPGTFKAKEGILLFQNKKYAGTIEVKKKGSKGYIYINHVSMPQYLVSVVGHEMSDSWPLEALKAQTVVARGYVLAKMNQASGSDYDVNTTVSNQVYGGIPSKKNNLEKAVSATHNKVVVYQSGLAKVFFHSSCGGRLEAANEIWKEYLPYLQTKRSAFCQKTPQYLWKYTISAADFERIFSVPGLREIHITKRTVSKRVKEIAIVTARRKTSIDPVKFRRTLGQKNIRSYLFDIRLAGKRIQIAGRGYGHGVGLCQWGSRVMAKQHKMGHHRILRHFFPNTSISRLFNTEDLG